MVALSDSDGFGRPSHTAATTPSVPLRSSAHPARGARIADTATYFNTLARELAADPKALERRLAAQVAQMFGAPALAAGGAK